MRINIRTAGLLGRYLPAGSAADRAPMEIEDGATPLDVMTRLGLPEGRYLVSVNGAAVPAARRGATVLEDGDDLALMPPLKGG